jgi:hypothetical protein
MPNKIHSYRIIGEENGVVLAGANPADRSNVTKNHYLVAAKVEQEDGSFRYHIGTIDKSSDLTNPAIVLQYKAWNRYLAGLNEDQVGALKETIRNAFGEDQVQTDIFGVGVVESGYSIIDPNNLLFPNISAIPTDPNDNRIFFREVTKDEDGKVSAIEIAEAEIKKIDLAAATIQEKEALLAEFEKDRLDEINQKHSSLAQFLGEMNVQELITGKGDIVAATEAELKVNHDSVQYDLTYNEASKSVKVTTVDGLGNTVEIADNNPIKAGIIAQFNREFRTARITALNTEREGRVNELHNYFVANQRSLLLGNSQTEVVGSNHIIRLHPGAGNALEVYSLANKKVLQGFDKQIALHKLRNAGELNNNGFFAGLTADLDATRVDNFPRPTDVAAEEQILDLGVAKVALANKGDSATISEGDVEQHLSTPKERRVVALLKQEREGISITRKVGNVATAPITGAVNWALNKTRSQDSQRPWQNAFHTEKNSTDIYVEIKDEELFYFREANVELKRIAGRNYYKTNSNNLSNGTLAQNSANAAKFQKSLFGELQDGVDQVFFKANQDAIAEFKKLADKSTSGIERLDNAPVTVPASVATSPVINLRRFKDSNIAIRADHSPTEIYLASTSARTGELEWSFIATDDPKYPEAVSLIRQSLVSLSKTDSKLKHLEKFSFEEVLKSQAPVLTTSPIMQYGDDFILDRDAPKKHKAATPIIETRNSAINQSGTDPIENEGAKRVRDLPKVTKREGGVRNASTQTNVTFRSLDDAEGIDLLKEQGKAKRGKATNRHQSQEDQEVEDDVQSNQSMDDVIGLRKRPTAKQNRPSSQTNAFQARTISAHVVFQCETLAESHWHTESEELTKLQERQNHYAVHNKVIERFKKEGFNNNQAAKEAYQDIIPQALLLAAAEAGIDNPEDMILAIKYAKVQGGVNRKAKEEEFELGNLDEAAVKKFSSKFQKICEACGVYSGREGGKPVGHRLTYVDMEYANDLAENEDFKSALQNKSLGVAKVNNIAKIIGNEISLDEEGKLSIEISAENQKIKENRSISAAKNR